MQINSLTPTQGVPATSSSSENPASGSGTLPISKVSSSYQELETVNQQGLSEAMSWSQLATNFDNAATDTSGAFSSPEVSAPAPTAAGLRAQRRNKQTAGAVRKREKRASGSSGTSDTTSPEDRHEEKVGDDWMTCLVKGPDRVQTSDTCNRWKKQDRFCHIRRRSEKASKSGLGSLCKDNKKPTQSTSTNQACKDNKDNEVTIIVDSKNKCYTSRTVKQTPSPHTEYCPKDEAGLAYAPQEQLFCVTSKFTYNEPAAPANVTKPEVPNPNKSADDVVEVDGLVVENVAADNALDKAKKADEADEADQRINVAFDQVINNKNTYITLTPKITALKTALEGVLEALNNADSNTELDSAKTILQQRIAEMQSTDDSLKSLLIEQGNSTCLADVTSITAKNMTRQNRVLLKLMSPYYFNSTELTELIRGVTTDFPNITAFCTDFANVLNKDGRSTDRCNRTQLAEYFFNTTIWKRLERATDEDIFLEGTMVGAVIGAAICALILLLFCGLSAAKKASFNSLLQTEHFFGSVDEDIATRLRLQEEARAEEAETLLLQNLRLISLRPSITRRRATPDSQLVCPSGAPRTAEEKDEEEEEEEEVRVESQPANPLDHTNLNQVLRLDLPPHYGPEDEISYKLMNFGPTYDLQTVNDSQDQDQALPETEMPLDQEGSAEERLSVALARYTQQRDELRALNLQIVDNNKKLHITEALAVELVEIENRLVEIQYSLLKVNQDLVQMPGSSFLKLELTRLTGLKDVYSTRNAFVIAQTSGESEHLKINIVLQTKRLELEEGLKQQLLNWQYKRDVSTMRQMADDKKNEIDELKKEISALLCQRGLGKEDKRRFHHLTNHLEQVQAELTALEKKMALYHTELFGPDAVTALALQRRLFAVKGSIIDPNSLTDEIYDQSRHLHFLRDIVVASEAKDAISALEHDIEADSRAVMLLEEQALSLINEDKQEQESTTKKPKKKKKTEVAPIPTDDELINEHLGTVSPEFKGPLTKVLLEKFKSGKLTVERKSTIIKQMTMQLIPGQTRRLSEVSQSTTSETAASNADVEDCEENIVSELEKKNIKLMEKTLTQLMSGVNGDIKQGLIKVLHANIQEVIASKLRRHPAIQQAEKKIEQKLARCAATQTNLTEDEDNELSCFIAALFEEMAAITGIHWQNTLVEPIKKAIDKTFEKISLDSLLLGEESKINRLATLRSLGVGIGSELTKLLKEPMHKMGMGAALLEKEIAVGIKRELPKHESKLRFVVPEKKPEPDSASPQKLQHKLNLELSKLRAATKSKVQRRVAITRLQTEFKLNEGKLQEEYITAQRRHRLRFEPDEKPNTPLEVVIEMPDGFPTDGSERKSHGTLITSTKHQRKVKLKMEEETLYIDIPEDLPIDSQERQELRELKELQEIKELQEFEEIQKLQKQFDQREQQ